MDNASRLELIAALAPLKSGLGADGRPLDMLSIATDVRANTQKYAQARAESQARANQRLRFRKFKG